MDIYRRVYTTYIIFLLATGATIEEIEDKNVETNVDSVEEDDADEHIIGATRVGSAAIGNKLYLYQLQKASFTNTVGT